MALHAAASLSDLLAEPARNGINRSSNVESRPKAIFSDQYLYRVFDILVVFVEMMLAIYGQGQARYLMHNSFDLSSFVQGSNFFIRIWRQWLPLARRRQDKLLESRLRADIVRRSRPAPGAPVAAG